MGELYPLLIPDSRWSVVLVDFILELPDAYGYNAVMVAVDSVRKRAHFIPATTTYSTLGAANLYHKNVLKVHGLSDAFVSNWGLQFIIEFTRGLY